MAAEITWAIIALVYKMHGLSDIAKPEWDTLFFFYGVNGSGKRFLYVFQSPEMDASDRSRLRS